MNVKEMYWCFQMEIEFDAARANILMLKPHCVSDFEWCVVWFWRLLEREPVHILDQDQNTDNAHILTHSLTHTSFTIIIDLFNLSASQPTYCSFYFLILLCIRYHRKIHFYYDDQLECLCTVQFICIKLLPNNPQ